MLSCLKATEMIEKRLLFKLSLKEKIQIKIHTKICEVCFLYEKQSKAITDSLSRQADTKTINPEQLVNLKSKIISKLESKK